MGPILIDSVYGLFEGDYRPKKSATYLHNLTTILSEDGVAPLGWLNYAITDQPATVHDLLLRKSDGTFELVVWSEKAEGTNRITVNLGRSHAWVKLYDPTIGITPTEILTGIRSVSITMSHRSVVLEMK